MLGRSAATDGSRIVVRGVLELTGDCSRRPERRDEPSCFVQLHTLVAKRFCAHRSVDRLDPWQRRHQRLCLLKEEAAACRNAWLHPHRRFSPKLGPSLDQCAANSHPERLRRAVPTKSFLPNVNIPLECATSIRLVDCDLSVSPPHCRASAVTYRKGCEQVMAVKQEP